MLKKLLLILFIIYNRLKAQRLTTVANHLAYVEAKMTNISVTDVNYLDSLTLKSRLAETLEIGSR